MTKPNPDYWPKISDLQASLPVLDAAPLPFDPDDLYAWARTASTRQRHMARFVLDVFNHYVIDELDEGQPPDCRLGHFDLTDACAGLDSIHRAVIARWVQDPWWA